MQITVIQKKRWTLWQRIGVISLAIILLVVSVVAVGGYWYIARSLPQTSGTLQLKGLSQPVHVFRDAEGVPHIDAVNMNDLFKAQGFVVAQDRMFQMDLARRQASGELSEVVGKVALDRDRFFRAFGLRRAAEASLAKYPAEYRQYLEDYAQGVNAYIAQAKQNGTLPIEFKILGYEPTAWTAVDSLTIGKYMAYDLGGHWQGEAFRYGLLEKFGQEKAFDLFPSYPKDAPTIVQTAQTNPIDITNSFADAVFPHELNGSNNWVVSGTKSASGKPILSNDPHLGLNRPAIWYENHLSAPGYQVSGVVFAGIPGVVIGHTPYIAWGVTNVGPDVQQLYIEKRNPANPDQFLHNGKWETAQVIKETIHVKGEKDVTYDVQITRHGPIISEFANDKHSDTALSLKWTALEPSTELEAVILFAKAKNWDQFKTALTYFDTPAQNFVFASTDGTIAYRANGEIPIRPKGDDGSLPVPGWNDDHEWTGYIPWDQLPTVVNPASGWIATANNKVIDDNYSYHITDDWAQPYREERISEVLQSKQVLTVADMQKLQFDHIDLQAREFLPLFIQSLEKQRDQLSPVEKKALPLLKSWNYDDDKDLGAPLVFRLMMNDIPHVLFDKQIEADAMKMFEDRGEVTDQLIRRAAAGNPGPWVQAQGGLDAVILKAYQQAVKRATSLQGNDPQAWKWGDFHSVPFHHPLSAVSPLDLLFDTGSTPMGGSQVTVGAAGWNEDTGEVDHGAAWRTVVDLANPLESFNVVGPGESGHPLSQWYANQVEDWTTGKYHVTSMKPSVYQQTDDELTLVP